MKNILGLLLMMGLMVIFGGCGRAKDILFGKPTLIVKNETQYTMVDFQMSACGRSEYRSYGGVNNFVSVPGFGTSSGYLKTGESSVDIEIDKGCYDLRAELATEWEGLPTISQPKSTFTIDGFGEEFKHGHEYTWTVK